MLVGLVTTLGAAPLATAGVSPGQTLRVSVRSDQAQAQLASHDPSVSADGRYVVFSSSDRLDTTALPDDDDAPNDQIYVRDLVANTTRLLTFTYVVPGDGPVQARPVDGDSGFPSISASGRYVAIQTTFGLAPGAIPPDDFTMRVVLIDRDPDGDGQLDEKVGADSDAIAVSYSLLSESSDSPDPAFLPSISADGQTVVYEEQPDGPSRVVLVRLVPGPGEGPFDVVRRTVFPQQAGLVLGSSWSPSISADGKRIVAQANYSAPAPPPIPFALDPALDPALDSVPTRPAAAALQADPPGERVVAFDVSAVNPDSGSVPALRVDIDPQGLDTAHRGGNRPRISGDGRKVVFEMSVDVCTSPGCEFPLWFVRAYLADPDPDGNGTIDSSPKVEYLSRDSAGDVARGIMPAISADGRYAAFVTDAEDTHNGVDRPLGSSLCAVPRFPPIPFTMAAQTQSACQVVVRDLVLDQQRLVAEIGRLPGELASPSIEQDCPGFQPGDTCASDGIAEMPALAGNGSVVAYTSDAEDLVSDDTNDRVDVFARRFTPQVQATPIDFGGVQVGDTANAGTVVGAGTVAAPSGFGPLTIDSITISGADFGLDASTCGPALHPGETCAITVDFTPTADGDRTGTLDLTPSFQDVVKVPLSGVGTPFPQPDPAFEVQPAPLDFGQRLIMTDSGAATVTVRNAGVRPMTIGTVTLPPLLAPSAPGDYRIVTDDCSSRVLATGTECSVTVVHRPLGPGERPAVLRFDQLTPAGVQPHLVELRGAGTAPLLQVNPGVVTVGRITTVIGTGFPPGQVVSIRMPGHPELAQATVDGSGAFTRTIQVYPNAVPGSRVVEATVDGIAPAIGDTENLLVVPGSIGPPDFLVRR